ncbi:MAG: hypothetical protein HY711_10675 [Candidatus Melainabacteria bacterium]|nr:hypothetical protein [Candidatus Melainabacteria bacterium]
MVIHESIASLPGWGCHARLSFEWGTTIKHEQGISGIAIIVPTINCSVWKDGLSQTTEVTPNVHVANRLFTHPSVPDRRTPKS